MAAIGAVDQAADPDQCRQHGLDLWQSAAPLLGRGQPHGIACNTLPCRFTRSGLPPLIDRLAEGVGLLCLFKTQGAAQYVSQNEPRIDL